jgi:uncharacterized RDD family membrane protein YckC
MTPLESAGGWYPDPDGPGLRWWDGWRWTPNIHRGGVSGFSPPGSWTNAPPPLPFHARRASFGPRAGAWMIDALITMGPPMVAYLVLFLSFFADAWSNEAPDFPAQIFPVLAAVYLIPTVYHWAFAATSGRTIGMRIVGLRVVDSTTGHRLPAGRAALRGLFTGALGSVMYGIGFLWMVWDRQGRTVSDIVSRSTVVDLRPDVEDLSIRGALSRHDGSRPASP